MFYSLTFSALCLYRPLLLGRRLKVGHGCRQLKLKTFHYQSPGLQVTLMLKCTFCHYSLRASQTVMDSAQSLPSQPAVAFC